MGGNMMYTCPVCFYSELTEPSSDWNICPCCATEFENDDSNTSHAELRQRWLVAGAPWFSRAEQPSTDWQQYLEKLRRETSSETRER